MMHRRIRTLGIALAFATLPLSTTGCATSIAQWIVRTRDHQGDVALAHRNYADASNAYQLALKIDPHDEHARDGLVGVQTPQAFRADVLRRAHHGDPDATDDAALAEAAGATVRVVPGDARNLKVTTPADLEIAQALAAW